MLLGKSLCSAEMDQVSALHTRDKQPKINCICLGCFTLAEVVVMASYSRNYGDVKGLFTLFLSPDEVATL